MEIYKIGDRVFQIGMIHSNVNFLNSIISILDYGFKFIPSWNISSHALFFSILKHIDTNMIKLNKKLFFIRKNTARFFNGDYFDFKKFYENYNKKFENKISIKSCENFDCVFDKNLERSCNDSRFFISKDTLDFRLEIFQNLSDSYSQIEHNLNSFQLESIYNFSKHKPFKIVECDKNIGSAIISHELYNTLVSDNLSNTSIYKELVHNPFCEVMSKIKTTLSTLYSENHINKNLFDKLIKLDECKLGSFRLLPKLHKDKFSCRPIINCNKHPTSILSKLIDIILQPLVKQSFSYIKDSQGVLLKTKDLSIPEGCVIYSCDFESLYTNIDVSKLIIITCESVTPFLSNSKYIDLFAFQEILKLVLYNNIFKNNNRFFIQVSGIVMGTIYGPSLVNTFVSNLEKH